MKKNSIYIFLLVALLGIAAFLYIKRGGNGSISSNKLAFSIEDTSAVDKIILSDKTGRILQITKTNKIWFVNDSIRVRRDVIGVLLETIKRVEVKSPVNKPMKENLMKQLATGLYKCKFFLKVIC